VSDNHPESTDPPAPAQGPDGQRGQLEWAMEHAFSGSPFLRAKFESAGLKPADIRSAADLEKLPFSTKEELRDAYPYGWAAVPLDRMARVHASSGTTGKRTMAYYTEKDLEHWTEMFARCYRMAGVGPGDRVQITPGYGLWSAGVGFQAGAERAGAMAVPVGPGNVELQLELMRDLKSTVLTATASFALLLSEETERRGLRPELAVRLGIFGSERWSTAMRQRIESLLTLESFDIYGMTELYGPGMGIDCHLHSGIHYWSDFFIVELIDPLSGGPAKPGDLGEIVITTLQKEAMPLLRYRTRDLTRVIEGPCPCGSVYPRFDRLSGRSDDMIKVRGVALFPSQVDSLLGELAGLSSEYQLVIERQGGREEITLRVECKPSAPTSRATLAETVRHTFWSAFDVTPEVELLEIGALPRTNRKTRRVVDRRQE
jgi:phenylacetate-CoA ligase